MSRYKGWGTDTSLQDDLHKYVRENLWRQEILSFVERDYPQYKWSL